jgi:hypothetical protein
VEDAVQDLLSVTSHVDLETAQKNIKDLKAMIVKVQSSVESSIESVRSTKSNRTTRAKREEAKKEKDEMKRKRDEARKREQEGKSVLAHARKDLADAARLKMSLPCGVIFDAGKRDEVAGNLIQVLDKFPGASFQADTPFMIVLRSDVSGFVASSEALQSGIAAFKTDYPGSETAKQKKKVARPAPQDVGSRFQSTCVGCAAAWSDAIPLGSLSALSSSSFFAYCAGLTFLGTDFLALPTYRHIVEGDSVIICMPFTAAMDIYTHNYNQQPPSLDELCKALAKLDTVDSFAISKDKIFHGTLGAGCGFFLPAGWILSTYTLNTVDTVGLRTSLFVRKPMPELESLHKFLVASKVADGAAASVGKYLESATRAALVRGRRAPMLSRRMCLGLRIHIPRSLLSQMSTVRGARTQRFRKRPWPRRRRRRSRRLIRQRAMRRRRGTGRRTRRRTRRRQRLRRTAGRKQRQRQFEASFSHVHAAAGIILARLIYLQGSS